MKTTHGECQERHLGGAAEFCLLSAPSELPLISSRGPGGGNGASGSIYDPRNGQIWSLSIHRAVASHSPHYEACSFQKTWTKSTPGIADAQRRRPVIHYYCSLFLWFTSDPIQGETADTFLCQRQTSVGHLRFFFFYYVLGECST